MTLEEALKRIEFLENALDDAIGLAKIEQARYSRGFLERLCTSHYYEWCDFEDAPELAKYIMENKK